jgi:hypothetical protein
VEIEEYRALLVQLVSLQRKLVQVFERNVQVIPLLSGFPDELRSQFEDIIKPGHSITQILRGWPNDTAAIPLFAWVKPIKGVVQLEEQSWLFEVHGASQVSFSSLPTGLDTEIMDHLKRGKTDILIGKQAQGGLRVEVEYLQGGRTDGVSAWSVFVFAYSSPPPLSELSRSDHEHLLGKLVTKGFLLPWPHQPAGGDRYFVLAEEEKQQRDG